MLLNIEFVLDGPGPEVRIESLVSETQNGQTEAFGLVYEEYSGRIYRYVYARTGQRELAEDLTQEVFVRALDGIRAYRDQGRPFSSWLLRIAHNLVIDHYRWQGKHRSVELAAVQPSSDGDPVAELEKKTDIAKVLQAVPSLSPGQKEAISLRFGAGLSLAETAAVMGKSVGAVKMLQHQAVLKLKKMLETKNDDKETTA